MADPQTKTERFIWYADAPPTINYDETGKALAEVEPNLFRRPRDPGLIRLTDATAMTEIKDARTLAPLLIDLLQVVVAKDDKVTGRTVSSTHLNTLQLSGTKVSEAGLKHLQGLPQLRSLDLSGNRVTDAGLEHLRGLTNLASLSLIRTKVTDKGLQHLQELPNLRQLYLWGTEMTDTGLEHIQHLKKLTNMVLAIST